MFWSTCHCEIDTHHSTFVNQVILFQALRLLTTRTGILSYPPTTARTYSRTDWCCPHQCYAALVSIGQFVVSPFGIRPLDPVWELRYPCNADLWKYKSYLYVGLDPERISRLSIEATRLRGLVNVVTVTGDRWLRSPWSPGDPVLILLCIQDPLALALAPKMVRTATQLKAPVIPCQSAQTYCAEIEWYRFHTCVFTAPLSFELYSRIKPGSTVFISRIVSVNQQSPRGSSGPQASESTLALYVTWCCVHDNFVTWVPKYCGMILPPHYDNWTHSGIASPW